MIQSQLYGFMLTFNFGMVYWKSYKQEAIADSTHEVEYIVTLNAKKDIVWMMNLILELGEFSSIVNLASVYFDNNDAITQA